MIKIEPGQSEIDLRPVIMPLLQELARSLGVGIEFDRRGTQRTDPFSSYTPEQVERWMSAMVERHRLAERMKLFQADWIHEYATGTGWYSSDNYRHRQYSRAYDRWRPTDAFVVYKDRDDPRFAHGCWRAVRAMAAYEDRSWDAVIAAILARGNAIDALASVGDSET